MHPVPVRLTPQQAAWIEFQTRCGSLTRSAAIRLCIQRAMESPGPLLTQASEPEPQKKRADRARTATAQGIASVARADRARPGSDS